MEAYEFLNVEAALIGVVVTQCRVEAQVDIPNPKPAEFVQVSRVGGVAGLVTDKPMVQFIVSALTWEAAAPLAALVRRRIHSITRLGDVPVYRVREVGGLMKSPDPDTGSPRYQFTAELKLRGSTAT